MTRASKIGEIIYTEEYDIGGEPAWEVDCLIQSLA